MFLNNSDDLRMTLFTYDMSIHDYFTFNVTSGHEYTNDDWGIGNYLELDRDMVCVYNNLTKSEAVNVRSAIAKDFTGSTPEIDDYIAMQVEYEKVMRTSRPDHFKNCFSTLNFELESFIVQSLSLHEGDSAQFKSEHELPSLKGWNTKMNHIVAYGSLAVFNTLTLLTVPFWHSKGYKWTTVLYLPTLVVLYYQYAVIWRISYVTYFAESMYDWCLIHGDDTGVRMADQSSIQYMDSRIVKFGSVLLWIFEPCWPMIIIYAALMNS